MVQQKIGLPPRNKDTLDYVGRGLYVMPTFQAPRDPTTTDTKYPIQTVWRNELTLDEWILVGFISGLAQWRKFADGSGGAIIAIDVDASTAPGTDPVVADGSGQITVTGAQVAAGTIGANVIRTDSLAANTYTVEIQRSTAVSASASLNNGVSHFNSNPGQFTVDANGFVSTNGSGNLLWVNQTADLSPLVKGTAYQANKAGTACTLTLPTGGTFGDTIRVQGFGATGWVLNAGAGQTIIVESGSSTVAGSISSSNQNDYIEVVCSSTTTTWFSTSHGGNLTWA